MPKRKLRKRSKQVDSKKAKAIDHASIHLPESVERQNRRIGFVKEEQQNEQHDLVFYHPVIYVHPREVPSYVKEPWLEMYNRAEKDENMWQSLLYKYGSDSFLLEDPSAVISLEEGIEKDYDAIPLNIMMKLRHGRELAESDVQKIEALETLKKELKLNPADRVAWLLDQNGDGDQVDDAGAVNGDPTIENGSDIFENDEEDDDEDVVIQEEVLRSGDEENEDSDETDSVISNEINSEGGEKDVAFARKCTDPSEDYNRIGFAAFDESLYPVMQLNPFDLCPCVFTSRCFRDRRDNIETGEMKRLVFWFGQSRGEIGREISLVSEHELYSYYEGRSRLKAKGINIDGDKLLKKALKEADSELKLPPADRLKWLMEKEDEKKDQLNAVSKSISVGFRCIGFVHHQGRHLPVIQLSPFDVAGPIRQKYLKQISQGVKSKAPTRRLIFWYGTREKDSSVAFSFVNPLKIVSYEEGMRKNYHKLPNSIQKKIEKNEKLTAKEQLYADGLKQMHDDLKYSRSERPHYLLLPDSDDEVESIFGSQTANV